MKPCVTFNVGSAKSGLWALIPVTARGAEYFIVQASPGNADIVSVNGAVIAPGEKRIMHRDQIRQAYVCGPDPAAEIRIWAVM